MISFGRNIQNILEELPTMIDEFLKPTNLTTQRYEHYQATSISDIEFHNTVCRSLDINRDGRDFVITSSQVSKVLKEWYEPTFQDLNLEMPGQHLTVFVK